MKSGIHGKPHKNSKHVHHIGGIPVEFPYQPYGTQLAFMARVISTLDRAQRDGHCHALLESPTGTGKSLSLLCSVLAWQKHRGVLNVNANVPQSKPDPKAFSDPVNYGGGFMPESQLSESPASVPASNTTGENKKKKTAPTIFYASRTHSQISQVIREYRKTAYRVPMTVLASRKHYCTNPNLRGRENIDEECKLLLHDRELGCLEFKNMSKVKCHPSVQKGGCHEAHDIEDLVKVGQTIKGCSYFAARAMSQDAQLIFCPYSYIINPIIRRAMEVDIKGSIIILDEAHNIEDMAREAGSVEVNEDDLEKLHMELGQLCHYDTMIYQPLYEMAQDIIGWMESQKSSLVKREFQHYFACWTGDKALKELQKANLSQHCFPALQECATKAIKAASDFESEAAHLSGMSAVILEGIFSSLSYFFRNNGLCCWDYQLVLRRFIQRDAGYPSGQWMYTFSLWCLNPAVVFKDVADLSLSVVLTSGTLSPVNSFSSELGVQFGTYLEAPHVIDVESQVWGAVIPSGPGNFPLNASYKTADGYDFQDALGKTLEEINKVVPGGSLIFFPSYKLMDKLCNRWRETGQWSRLNARKPLFIEPRGGNQDEFEAVLKRYYDSVLRGSKSCIGKRRKSKKLDANQCNATEPLDITKKNGAAFLAVCRGKVSEGIDFSDDNARAVIIVGIPFPNINDLQVAQKKKYNDTYKHSKNLLSGSDWYCHQAFRALNQAAGRCIRNRFDYGAIIFLDERFQEERNTMCISKWMRRSIKQFNKFETSLDDLSSFFSSVKDRISIMKSEQDSVKNSENFPPDNYCKDSTGKKNQKLNKTEPCDNTQKSLIVDHALTISGLSKRLNFHAEYDAQAVKCNEEVQASALMHMKDVECHEMIIDLDCDPQEDFRYMGVQSTATSHECREISLVQETPCIEDLATPGVLSKDENSSSTVVQMSAKCPGKVMMHSVSPINSACSLSRGPFLSAKTPERNLSANSELTPEQQSHVCLSVNSHAQKRKVLHSPVINLTEEERSDSDMIIEDCTVKTISPRILKQNEHAYQRREYSLQKNISQRPSKNGFTKTHTSASPLLEQRLQICCSLCRSPLGLPENELNVPCSINTSSKLILTSLLDGQLQPATGTVPSAISVLLADVSSVNQRLFDRDRNDFGQGIWCAEDGCVYNVVFCPFCHSSKNCLGVWIVATDASNCEFINKIFLYRDRINVKSPHELAAKDSLKTSNSPVARIADVNSINKFAYQSKQQIVGGWRTTRSKLRLPKKDVMCNSKG